MKILKRPNPPQSASPSALQRGFGPRLSVSSIAPHHPDSAGNIF